MHVLSSPSIANAHYVDDIIHDMLLSDGFRYIYDTRWEDQFGYTNPLVTGGKYIGETDYATMTYGLVHDMEIGGFYYPDTEGEANFQSEAAIFNAYPGGAAERFLYFEPNSTEPYSSSTNSTGKDFKFMTSGDFNDNSYDDIAVVTYNPTYGRNTRVMIFYDDGTIANYDFGDGNDFIGIASGDINGDGVEDIVIYNKVAGAWRLRVRVLDGLNPSNTLVFWNSGLSYSDESRVAVGDYNGDGADEIVAFNRDRTTIEAQVFGFHYNSGTNTGFWQAFTGLLTYYLESGYVIEDVTSGDFNGDYVDEIALFCRKPYPVSGAFRKRLLIFELDGSSLNQVNQFTEYDLISRPYEFTKLSAGNYHTSRAGDELAFIGPNGSLLTKLYYYDIYDDLNEIERLYFSTSLAGYDYLDVTGGNFDGAFKSGVFDWEVEASGNLSDGSFVVRVYPNPTSADVRIDLSGVEAISFVQLIDVTGRELSVGVQQAENRLVIDMTTLPKGTYYAIVGNELVREVIPIIRE